MNDPLAKDSAVPNEVENSPDKALNYDLRLLFCVMRQVPQKLDNLFLALSLRDRSAARVCYERAKDIVDRLYDAFTPLKDRLETHFGEQSTTLKVRDSLFACQATLRSMQPIFNGFREITAWQELLDVLKSFFSRKPAFNFEERRRDWFRDTEARECATQALRIHVCEISGHLVSLGYNELRHFTGEPAISPRIEPSNWIDVLHGRIDSLKRDFYYADIEQRLDAKDEIDRLSAIIDNHR